MDATLGRLDQRVTEQLGDGHHVHSVHGGDRRLGVAKVVKPATPGSPASLRMCYTPTRFVQHSSGEAT